MSNLDLWNKVEKTRIGSTKKVNQRGGFTAIDAYSQIKAATEQFGPVGEGWGWDVVNVNYPPNNTVVVHIKMWHTDRLFSYDVFGQKKLGTDDRPDEDAFKKALTDAITKGLSYCGFNGDVFLGMFDDNKYIEKLKRDEKKAEENPWTGPMLKTKLSEAIKQFVVDIGKAEDLDGLMVLQDAYAAELAQSEVDLPEWHERAMKRFSEIKACANSEDTDNGSS